MIGVTEIWLDHSVLYREKTLDGHSILRKGGGVSLFIYRTSMFFFSNLPNKTIGSNIHKYISTETKPLQVEINYTAPSQSDFLDSFENNLHNYKPTHHLYKAFVQQAWSN